MLVVSQSFSIPGSGAGASWTKATKETSQNHNGSQEPETSETLEALQLLWVAKLGEFLLGISDFWGGLGLFPHEPHSCCWLWHLPQGATRVPLHRPICDKNTMSIVWPIHVRIIHSVLKFILLVWGDFGPLERTGYDTVSNYTNLAEIRLWQVMLNDGLRQQERVPRSFCCFQMECFCSEHGRRLAFSLLRQGVSRSRLWKLNWIPEEHSFIGPAAIHTL